MNLPVEVIEAARTGRCVLVLGSCAAREAAELAGQDYPDGRALARLLGWQRAKLMPGARPKVEIPSVSAGAESHQKANGRSALVALIQKNCGVTGVTPSPAHRAAVSRFPLVLTTCWDDLLERAAAAEGLTLDVRGWGDALPEPEPGQHVLYRLRGVLARPESLVITSADRAARPFAPELKNQIRNLVRRYVLFFVGFRPDEEEFEQLWEDLSVCYGGELPRCHLAVSQGNIDDYQWQRWVWRGLLLFNADPVEALDELQTRVGEAP